MKLHAQRATNLNTVTGYGPGYIEINGARHSGNLIVAAASVQPWSAAGFESLQAADFDPVVSLGPEVILLGTGLRHRLVHPALTAFLARAGIALEIKLSRLNPSFRPCLEVADRGPGIEWQAVDRIFEPFFTGRKGGTGLGLFIARELCQLNRATLLYEPRSGGGSTFRVVFSDPQRWEE